MQPLLFAVFPDFVQGHGGTSAGCAALVAVHSPVIRLGGLVRLLPILLLVGTGLNDIKG